MAEKKISIPVRTALMPIFYKDFHCLASACRDNCCGGWEIAFSKKDYLRIKRAAKSEKLKEVLSNGMSRLRDQQIGTFYAHFKVGPDGVCAFQTDEKLCLLQLECGEETLPEVCRCYPRKNFYTPAAREFALSPSCEGVLALLWDLPQGIDFWEEPLPKKDWGLVEAEPRLARFADIRSFCVDVLQKRSLSFSRRVRLLGVLIQRLAELGWGGEGVVDGWLAWGTEQMQNPSAAVLESPLPERSSFLSGNIYTLLELYQNTGTKEKELYRSLFSAISADEDWEKNGLGQFRIDTKQYQRLEEQLNGLLGWSDYFFENLMVLIAFYEMFPKLLTPEKLWRSYVDLCSLYSFFRFAAVCGCGQEVSRERLFQVIGTVSRGLLHNELRREHLLDGLFKRGGGTLENMAVLAGS